MTSRSLFVGIDGGGTKTLVVVVDNDGHEVTRVRSGTSNPAIIGHRQAGEVLNDAMAQAAACAQNTPPFQAAWFGLSGSDRPEDRRRLLPHVIGTARDIRITNDAELLLGGLPDGIGVALVGGTGSIAFGANCDGCHARAGGWGHIFSDEGSGYDIVRGMLRAFAAEIDGRGPSTSLTKRLLDTYILDEPHQLIAHVYAPEMTKGKLAAMSRIVTEEAHAGDEVAMRIVAHAADDMADLARAVATRLGFTDEVALAVTGGLFLHEEMFRNRVVATLSRTMAISSMTIVNDPALTAARALASAARGKP